MSGPQVSVGLRVPVRKRKEDLHLLEGLAVDSVPGALVPSSSTSFRWALAQIRVFVPVACRVLCDLRRGQRFTHRRRDNLLGWPGDAGVVGLDFVWGGIRERFGGLGTGDCETMTLRESRGCPVRQAGPADVRTHNDAGDRPPTAVTRRVPLTYGSLSAGVPRDQCVPLATESGPGPHTPSVPRVRVDVKGKDKSG